MSSRPDLKLDWCSFRAAKYAVEHWHYSKTMPIGKLVKIGAWENGRFVGCVIFGSGGAANLPRHFELTPFELCELVRVALQEHQSPVTRIIRIALNMLKKQSPGIRLVVSYADPHFGHLGSIYQAGNWLYTGLSAPGLLYESVNTGKTHNRNLQGPHGFGGHSRDHGAIQRKYTERKNQLLAAGLIRPVRHPRKHRYVMPLDNGMRRRLQTSVRPYPKRAGSADSGTSAIQAEGGGASPTSALCPKTDKPQ